MAGHGIPNLIAIEYLDGYVYCTTDEPNGIQGYIGWREVDVFSPLTKIAVESAEIDSRYVNLRFCCNNRYWARHAAGKDEEWLVATSQNPDENISERSCTLFQPIVQEDNSFWLIHVQSRMYVRLEREHSRYLYLGDQPTSANFRFVDLDTIVMLPKHVTFKGDNGKYLKACDGTILGIIHTTTGKLNFSSDDGNAEATAYEVTMNPHGNLLIKSEYTGKYWRANPEEVRADTDDAATLFWPVKLNDRTIALQNAAAQKFCRRASDDALIASAPTIIREARLQLEELVLERKIYNVVFHMDKARIYDQNDVVVGEGSGTNTSSENAPLFINVSYMNSSCYSFISRINFILGVRTHFEAPIAHIAPGGNIEISSHLSAWRQWNKETQINQEETATYEAENVPPGRTVKVNYVATRGKYDIPISYTQHDQLSGDGSTVTTTHDDGLFTGANYYSFNFQQVEP